MNEQGTLTMRFPRFVFAVVLPVTMALTAGCDATRRDWRTCFHISDCGPNRGCSKNYQCEPVVLDSAAWDANQTEVPRGQGMDGGPAQVLLDGSSVDLSSSVDASDDVPVSAASVDGSAQLDSAAEAGPTVAADTGVLDGAP